MRHPTVRGLGGTTRIPERGRAVLVIAHPGHELRVHHWLESVRPVVLVLTDGSGGAGRSRLGGTRRVLELADAEPGAIFGRFSDRGLYAAILDGRVGLFRDIAAELAERIRAVDYVVGDAAEGYNPAHDLCRLLIDAGTARVRRMTGRDVPSFEFPLVGSTTCTAGEGAVRLDLDDDAFARKADAARGYAALAVEVDAAIAELGSEAFRTEVLVPSRAEATANRTGRPPYYEQYGERQVSRGTYAAVLRRREHMLPIARALADGWG